MPEELNPGESKIRQLLTECSEYITGQKDIAGKRFAGYHCGPYRPVLFLAFGDACDEEKIQLLKETVELAWNNIQGNLIIMKYPRSVKKEKLIREMEENIVKLRSVSEGVFQIYNDTRVYLFLEGEDTRLDEYIEVLNGDLNLYLEQIQLVVVMLLNEKTAEKREKAQKQLSALSKLKRERKIHGVLVLSNVLRNGRFLSEEAEKNQYRIAADVAFLSNSYEIATGEEYKISREIEDTLLQDEQMCTAAYIKCSKPSKKITQSTLRTILHIYEKSEQAVLESEGFDSSSHGFRKRLTRKTEEGIFGLETFMQQRLADSFPESVQLEDFPYFPEMQNIRKYGVESSVELEHIMRVNVQGLGIWDLFVKYNYLNKVEDYVSGKSEEIYEKVKDYLKDEFSYTEILAYAENSSVWEAILHDLEEPAIVAKRFSGDDVDSILCKLAEDKARQLFLKKAGNICIRALLDYYEECRKHAKLIKEVRGLVDLGYQPDDAICRYYEHRTEELFPFEKNRKVLGKYCTAIGLYCECLKTVFKQFVGENAGVYLTTFERELANRSESDTTMRILDELGFQNQKLKDECRFQCEKFPEGNSYCIAFAEAEFVDALENQENFKGKVFRTSRQDSVERIMICPLSCEIYT